MRATHRKMLIKIIIACALIGLVSFYRVFSILHFPVDKARPYIVYLGYVAIMLMWATSIFEHISSKHIRRNLFIIDVMMFLWITVELFEQTIFKGDILRTRYIEYLVFFPVVVITLLGFYASLHIGMPDDYKVPHKVHIVDFVSIGMMIFGLTDPLHHLVFEVYPSEPQPNLYFHATTGAYIIFSWAIILVALRIVIIFNKSNEFGGNYTLKGIAPFTEVILLIIYVISYILSDFNMDIEIVEFIPFLFFIEGLNWDIFCYVGLIPTNNCYEDVLRCSTVAMQILDSSGNRIIGSNDSVEVDETMFEKLRENKIYMKDENTEIRIFPLEDSYIVWQKNLSYINTVIARFRLMSKELETENELLEEEIRVGGEKSRIAAKNEIYDNLSGEVDKSLRLLKSLIARRESVSEKKELYKKIIIIGLYIKRRLNMRLIALESGELSREDMFISLTDISENLKKCGIDSTLSFEVEHNSSANYYIYCFDVIENILEDADFAVSKLDIISHDDASCEMKIDFEKPFEPTVKLRKLFYTEIEKKERSCIVHLREVWHEAF